MALNCIGYASFLMEEICLEGLDGITLESLWVRLSARLKLKILPAFRKKLWSMILQLKSVKYYLLPVPRRIINIYNRYENIDNRGNFMPIETDAQIYEYCPCKNDNGSCMHYDTREDVSDKIHEYTYEDVWTEWRDKLVIVGSTEQRWKAIAPTLSFSTCQSLPIAVYCILERVGRSRHNGELTIGECSLASIEKIPKKLAYLHKQLTSLNLVQKQHVSVKNNNVSSTCVLLHLNRFYHRVPNVSEKYVDTIENYLLQCPDKSAPVEKVKELFAKKKFPFVKMIQSSSFTRKIKVNKIPFELDENKAKALKGTRIVLQLIENSESSDKDCDLPVDSEVPRGSAMMGEGLLHQVYKCICKSKKQGLSMKEVSRMLGTEYSTTRFAIKYLMFYDLLDITVLDYKRQRTSKYISKEFKNDSIEIQKETNLEDKKNASDNIEPKSTIAESNVETDTNNIPSTSKLSTVEIQDTTTDLKDMNLSYRHSSKKILRMNLVNKYLAENHITCRLNEVKNYIAKHEKSKLVDNALIDQRSLKRLIYQMERENQLKVIQVKVTVEPYNTILLFICEPSIDIHHLYVKRNIEQTKQQLTLKKLRLSVDNQHVSQICNNKIKTAGNPYPFLPKFARLRIFHEFLFYLTYGHKNKAVELPVHVQNLLKSEKMFADDLPLAYEDSLDKCMFVPPLENLNFPEGWILLSDAINQLPLCLLSNLCFTNPNIPGISVYLNNPILCQTMMKHLPPPVQYYLTYKGRYKFILHKIVEQLCFLGLVQFGKQIMKDKDKICIYMNKNAILWDTTSSKSGYHKIEDKEYPTENFKFLSLEDVKKYWNRVYAICNNTDLGQRYAAIGEEVETVSPEVKMAHALEKKAFEDVVKTDCGYIPGDGFGAAGFDTMLFSHLKRSWTNNLIVPNYVSHEKPPVAPKTNASRGEKHLPPIATKGKKKVRVLKIRKQLKTRSPKYDETDKKLMEKLGSKRSSWKSTEDQILFLFKIAFHIIYPPRFSMNFHVIRDFMNTVCKVSKCTMAYRRRMIFLMRKPQNIRLVEIYLTEFRRDDVISNNYNNLYNQLKKGVHKKKPLLYVDEKCRIRLVELVNLLYQKFIEKNALNQTLLVLPKTLKDLYNEYEIEIPSLYKDEDKEVVLDMKLEIKNHILKSLIHSAMSCSMGKETYTFSLFDTYKNFPEGMLRSTINSLRLSGMISINRYEVQSSDKKMIKKKTSTNASHFKLSQSYFIQGITTMPSTLYTQAYKYIQNLKLERHTGNNVQVTGGGVAALFDLISVNLVDVCLIAPYSPNIHMARSKNQLSKNKLLTPTECSVMSEKNMQRTYVIAGYGWNVFASGNMDVVLHNTPEFIDSIANEIISNSLLFTNRNKSKVDAFDGYVFDESIMYQVFQFICVKYEIGASQDELKERFVASQTITIKELSYILQELINRNMISRTGIVSWRWVSKEYSAYWCIKRVPCIKITKPSKNGDSNDENMIEDSSNLESDLTNTTEDNSEHSLKRKRENSESESVALKKICVDDTESDMISNDLEGLLENESRTDDNTTQDAMDTSVNVLDEYFNTTEAQCEKVNYLYPRPWIRPDGSLNYPSLFHWISAILNHLLLHPIMNLVDLQKRFNFLQFHEIHFLIEIMEKIGCVSRVRIAATKKPSLFNRNTALDLIIEKPTGLEDVEELFVEVLEAATIKFTTFKGQILDAN